MHSIFIKGLNIIYKVENLGNAYSLGHKLTKYLNDNRYEMIIFWISVSLVTISGKWMYYSFLLQGTTFSWIELFVLNCLGPFRMVNTATCFMKLHGIERLIQIYIEIQNVWLHHSVEKKKSLGQPPVLSERMEIQ